ncbi:HAD-IC family P-type ATPase [Candidatus Woesearchaeota archaeon]|nr:HAD-IC family P-type ATPase [Candidatus Woesearchaeota archaeon]
MENFHSKTIEDVLNDLKTSLKGISSQEASSRVSTYGYNELKESKKKTKLALFLEQFKNFLVLILIAAAIISIFIKEIKDAILIMLIVIFNGIFGFIQEYKSEKAIEALKKLTSLNATVIRDGKQIQIPTKELVPGDIVLLEEGSKIPADCRLIEVINLETQEASLTGESTPVSKITSLIKEDAPIADQKNMVFSSTIVTRGRGKAIVVKTGMNTEIGTIASLIQKQQEELTPLQQKLEVLGKKLGIASLVICGIIMIVLLFTKESLLEALIISVSLAVAAIPEGLPAIVTISLALGVQRMSKKNALIRKLPAVETLGSTNVILSDKTGTITKNEMTVKKIYTGNLLIEVTGSGYENKGQFTLNNKKHYSKDLEQLLIIGMLCNNASVDFSKKQIIGDPTEASLIVSASKAGLNKNEIETQFKRLQEIPFDSEKKYMATIHEKGNKKFLYVKGAPDMIIDLCAYVLINNKQVKLDSKKKKQILDTNNQLASEALRVLGFAYKEGNVKM